MSPPRKIDPATVRRLHAAGLTGAQMAARLGVTPPAVQYECRRQGLPLLGGRNGQGKLKPGDRFGRLVVQFDTGRREAGEVVWRCVCDCGQIWDARTNRLTRKDGGRSCGCLRFSRRWPGR